MINLDDKWLRGKVSSELRFTVFFGGAVISGVLQMHFNVSGALMRRSSKAVRVPSSKLVPNHSRSVTQWTLLGSHMAKRSSGKPCFIAAVSNLHLYFVFFPALFSGLNCPFCSIGTFLESANFPQQWLQTRQAIPWTSNVSAEMLPELLPIFTLRILEML